MALQLRLDGKDIGEIDNDGKVTGPQEDSEEKEEQLVFDIPEKVRRQENRQVADELNDNRESDDEESDDEESDDEESSPDGLTELRNQISMLTTLVSNLNNQPPSAARTAQAQEIKELIEDTIPNDLDKEKDPYGLARTMKGIVKALNQMGSKVERLDQHTQFSEGMRILEREKSNHKVFQDEELGGIAEKVLEAELRSSGDPIPTIVRRVASQFKGLGRKSTKKYIKDKVKKNEKVPATLRNKDGVTASITVNKPKSVKDAGNAYREFRRQRDKMNRGS